MNAFELIESPEVSHHTFLKAKEELEQNYGVEYSDGKLLQLFRHIREDGWNEERFLLTLRWLIRTKPFAAWTLSDWFTYNVRVYPYEWYMRKCATGADPMSFDRYELADGTIVYREKDGQTLPFKVAPPPPKVT